jgi:4-amino-4-deoxy-L-arabinose transferase-like glycosyltransferase
MGASLDTTSEPRFRHVLLLILLFGFAVRFSSMFWGIGLFSFDHGVYHPDEPKVVNYVRNFPESFWTQEDFRYPVGLHHALLALYLPLKRVANTGFAQSVVSGNTERLWAFLVCRFGVVLIGTATVWFVYASVRRLTCKNPPALIAAAVASLFPYAVLNSGLAATDVPLSLAIIAVFYAYIRLEERIPNVRWGWFGLGCLAGVAIGVKYTAAFLGPTLVILMVWRHRAAGASWILTALNLARLGAGTLLAFFIVMPHAVFRYHLVIGSLRYEMSRIESRPWELAEYLDKFWTAFGWPGTVLVLCAAVLLAWKRPRGTAALGLFTLFFILLTMRGLLARYLIALTPLAAVAVGCAAAVPEFQNHWIERLRRAGMYSLFAACGLLLFACLYGRYAWDTRSEVTRYIQREYPTDTSIAYAVLGTEKNRQRWRWPRFAYGEYPAVKLGDEPHLIVATTPPHELLRQDLRDGGRRFRMWQYDYKLETPSQRFMNLYNALATGTNDYRIVARFSRTRLPIEFPGYPLAVYERQSE